MDPVIPAKWSKALWLLYTIGTVTVIPSLAFVYGVQSKPATLAGFIAVGLAAVLRGLTTNSWGTPPAALLLVAALGFSSCTHLKAVGSATFDCSFASVKSQLPALETKVVDALTQGPSNWAPALEAIGVDVGLDVLRCAVQAVANDLRSESMGIFVSTDVRIARAQAWLAIH
jgi:hypothetical protein